MTVEAKGSILGAVIFNGCTRRALLATVLAVPVAPVFAQFRVEVSGIGLSQLPIAITPFEQEEHAPQQISTIIRADFERSGQFRNLETIEKGFSESMRPDLSKWLQVGADALVVGSVMKKPNGHYDVRFRLWDVVRGLDLGGQSYEVKASDLRLASHRVADFIYEKLTPYRGVFATRIAYVTKQNNGYDLWVSDSDGENSQSALSSPAPIISPSWSPDGNQIAYVSFESRKPVVYVHDVATGRRRLTANFRGSNSAPAWAPDGRSLAVTLTQDGSSQIYLLDVIGSGAPKRLTKSSSIDTEPVFSPDGAQLFFVSDRGGSPQIYRMSINDLVVERVTFQGNYNISPSISADGRLMAFVSRINGLFKLHVMDFATGTVKAISDTLADERPSFSPNGRLIIYATQIDGREALVTTTLDGGTKARLNGRAGDIREPSWGPFNTQKG